MSDRQAEVTEYKGIHVGDVVLCKLWRGFWKVTRIVMETASETTRVNLYALRVAGTDGLPIKGKKEERLNVNFERDVTSLDAHIKRLQNLFTKNK